MRYLGLDVHVKATVWCLLDATGEPVERGKIDTTVPELQGLIRRLAEEEPVLVGQEVGKMAYLVHDAVTAIGTKILSFNAGHLRMIAASRKKTDRRDAYWIAKALHSGMTPPPVYLPGGEVRELRALLSRRKALTTERTRWLLRARAYLEAAGYTPPRARTVERLTAACLARAEGLDEVLAQSLDLCKRMQSSAELELERLDVTLHQYAQRIETVHRLETIPGISERLALLLYAWIGDVTRFGSARELAS